MTNFASPAGRDLAFGPGSYDDSCSHWLSCPRTAIVRSWPTAASPPMASSPRATRSCARAGERWLAKSKHSVTIDSRKGNSREGTFMASSSTRHRMVRGTES